MHVTIKVAEPTGITVAVFDNDGIISVTEYGNIKPVDVRAALFKGGYTAEEITIEG